MMDMIQAACDEASDALQVLMLGLGGEILAIEAGMVREIIDPVPTTRVSGARAHVPALINVRGNIVPLADLRVRFGMERPAFSGDTRFVVIEIAMDGEPLIVGIVADKVYEVSEISSDNRQPTPRIGMQWKPEYIRFIAKWNEEFVVVPDLELMLS